MSVIKIVEYKEKKNFTTVILVTRFRAYSKMGATSRCTCAYAKK